MYWFYANGEKVCKGDDGICNRKIEFKAKRELMQMNRNYKKVDEKISRVWKYKEIVTKSDLYSSAFESLFSQITRIWKLFSRSVGTFFSCKLLCLKQKTTLPLSRKKFFLSIASFLVGKAGFSLKQGSIRHIFQQSKI